LSDGDIVRLIEDNEANSMLASAALERDGGPLASQPQEGRKAS
jgi:hypothetical protein